MTTTLICVEGTFGGEEWVEVGAPWRTFMEGLGFRIIRFRGWSTDIDGLPRLFSATESGPHSDWIAGGWGLHYLIQTLKGPIVVVAHSHGGNVAVYCPALTGTKIDRLLTISTPVRRDMRKVAIQAKKNIGRWRHVAAKGGDWVQRLGELFDRRIGWRRKWPQAHENVLIPEDVGHSGLLKDPKFFDLWIQDGLVDFLRGTTHVGQGRPRDAARRHLGVGA